MTKPHPLALETSSWLRSITRILSAQTSACLVICRSRDDFIQILAKEVGIQSTEAESSDEQPNILHATIARISASRNIQALFAPSLMHLRAILNTLPAADENLQSVYILGLPDLHLSMNELSAQSLSRTLALAIEITTRKNLKMECLCPRRMLDHWEEDMLQQQVCIWERRLPVLTASGRNGEDRIWSGRTVMMGHVFYQWCKVVKASE